MAKPEREPVFLKVIITRDVHERIAEFKDRWSEYETKEVVVRVETGEGQAYEFGSDLQEFLSRLGLEEAGRKLLVKLHATE